MHTLPGLWFPSLWCAEQTHTPAHLYPGEVMIFTVYLFFTQMYKNIHMRSYPNKYFHSG